MTCYIFRVIKRCSRIISWLSKRKIWLLCDETARTVGAVIAKLIIMLLRMNFPQAASETVPRNGDVVSSSQEAYLIFGGHFSWQKNVAKYKQ